MTALARLSLRFRTVTLLVVFLLIGAGSYALVNLKQELFPSLEVPYLVVSAREPGAGPNQVVSDLTEPIEDAISSTEGLNHVSSNSLEGTSVVIAEYEFGTDMEAREQQVREALTDALPQGLEAPEVERISPDSFPIYSVAVSGADQAALQSFVAGTLEPALSGLDGVGDMTTAGGSNQIFSVVVDPRALAAVGLTPGDVTATLKNANLSSAVGGIAARGTQFPVRVTSSLDDLAQLRSLRVAPQVPAPGSTAVPLSQVAQVSIAPDESGSTISRLDGVPAITVDVIKSQEANTVDTVGRIEDAVADISIPGGIKLVEVINQAPEIENSLSDLAREAIVGALLAVVMILLFLRSFRGTMVSGISIPLSLLVAFILMRSRDISLNILTLGALSVAAGRVIDDAIVVLENIHRLLSEERLPKYDAVLKGTSQMVPAITGSTLTTVAVFLPLAFIGGLVGEVFVGFALTVTFALLASLLVAVTVVPVLALTFLKERPASRKPAREPALRRAYRPAVAWALRHRILVVMTAIVLLAGSLFTITRIPTTLFPTAEPDALQLSAMAAPGSSLQATSDLAAQVEKGLSGLDGIERFSTVIGGGGGSAAFLGGGGGSNSAKIIADLEEGADPEALIPKVEALVDRAGLRGGVSPVVNQQGPESTNLSVQVTGSDFTQVTASAQRIQDRLRRIGGIEELAANVAFERPELVVRVSPGSSAAGAGPEVANTLRAILSPTPATTININGQPLQVVVITNPAALAGPEALAALPIARGVRLDDVADVIQVSSPAAITRYDQDRSVEITGVITAENIGRTNMQVQQAIDELGLPEGVDTTLGGAAETMNESFSSLLTSMVIAVALVYLAMVATFGSLLTPFVILFALPLAAIGAFPALLATGRELGLPAMLGLLMLIGIVVTNAIVMLEFVERLRRVGSSIFEALVKGASIRLRPILMTALVTILALSPLALGLSEGALLSSSLAIVVIGGLFSSTFLTLFVIPVFYSIFKRMPREQARRRLVQRVTVPRKEAPYPALVPQKTSPFADLEAPKRHREAAVTRPPGAPASARPAAYRSVRPRTATQSRYEALNPADEIAEPAAAAGDEDPFSRIAEMLPQVAQLVGPNAKLSVEFDDDHGKGPARAVIRAVSPKGEKLEFSRELPGGLS